MQGVAAAAAGEAGGLSAEQQEQLSRASIAGLAPLVDRGWHSVVLSHGVGDREQWADPWGRFSPALAPLGFGFGAHLTSLELSVARCSVSPALWPTLLQHLPRLRRVHLRMWDASRNPGSVAALAQFAAAYDRSAPPLITIDAAEWSDFSNSKFASDSAKKGVAALRAALNLPPPAADMPSYLVVLQLPRS